MSLEDKLQGYFGEVRELLEKAGAEIGDEIEIEVRGKRYRGILMARYELADPGYVVIKLPNGYNIGIKASKDMLIRKIASAKKPRFTPPPRPPSKPELPKVTVVSTGGTIASRIDYRTGGVRAALTAGDLLSVVPELSDIADLDAKILFSIFSEDMTPELWNRMAEESDKLIRKGEDGIVIAHGTDTMVETAQYLAKSIKDKTIVLTGAMIPFKFGSSDGLFNMGCALAFVQVLPPGVYIAMNGKYFTWDKFAESIVEYLICVVNQAY